MKNLVALVVFLGVGAASANPTIQTLKAETASLFDLGMFRLEMLVASSRDSIHSIYSRHANSDPIDSWAFASYSARDDMIRVGAGFMDEQSSEKRMEAGCREVLRTFRISASKSVWRFFSHYGDEGRSSVQGLYDRIVLRCYVSGNDTSEGRFWATMPLKGNLGEDDGFKIGKWRMDNE